MYKVPCILNRTTIFYCRDSSNLHCIMAAYCTREIRKSPHSSIWNRKPNRKNLVFFCFISMLLHTLCVSHRRFERKRNTLRLFHSYCTRMKLFLSSSSRLRMTGCGNSLIGPSCVKIRFLSQYIICTECYW